MRVIVTAGPTREYIDDVRFITNASSGRMGCAVAGAAVRAGHEVTLLRGPVALGAPAGCGVVPFVSVEDLQRELAERFAQCDALVMTAAVGDFRVAGRVNGKIPRSGGPITIRLVPTEDVLAGVARTKRADQLVIAFAVESGAEAEIEAKARGEMARKHADYVVVNTPAAMGTEASRACILAGDRVVLPWAQRAKDELAAEIVKLLRKG